MKDKVEKVLVKPREGFTVRNEETKQPIPPEGMKVTMSKYYRNRIREGALLVVDDARPKPAQSAPSAKPEKPAAGGKKEK